MATGTAYVLLRNGYADWEPASALAELRRTFGFSVKTIGMDMNSIASMGGMTVIPDIALSEFTPESAAILILPGGEAWMKEEVDAVSEAVIAMIAADRPVAAICAATLALAHAGLLDSRLHTSNGSGFIEKYVPKYWGQEMYLITFNWGPARDYGKRPLPGRICRRDFSNVGSGTKTGH